MFEFPAGSVIPKFEGLIWRTSATTPVFLHRHPMRKPNLLNLIKPFLSLFLTISLIQGSTTADDVICLKNLKAEISDPNGYLSSWTFTNSTPGSICQYNGIECWNNNENRVLNLRLTNMGLKGHFPSQLKLCASLTGLDLSRNSFTGSIPGNISGMVWDLFNLYVNIIVGYGTCLRLYQHNYRTPVIGQCQSGFQWNRMLACNGLQ